MNENEKLIEQNQVITLDKLIFLINSEKKIANVIGHDKAKGDVLIPISIDYNDSEYIITEISEGAFKYSYGIQTVKFPTDSKLLIIGKEAFSKSSIESILIPLNVTQICECAFSYCTQLREIKIDSNSQLKTIEKGAFFKSSIESISIPSHVTKICGYAFYQCKKLKKVEIEKNSELQTIEKFNFYGSSVEKISIPSSVKELGEGWCIGTPKLNNINVFINNDLINIKNYGDEFVIGKSNFSSEIFDVLLFSNRKMKLIKIPSFIKLISSYSFSESIIQSITIPSSITKICQFAFFHCNNLQNVEVENNSELHTIEKSAFSNPLVESISIPSSVVEFAEGWCCDTPKLNKINVFINNNIENIKKYGDNLVVGKSNICNESFDVLLLSSRKIKKINIPPFIKIISSYAFSESEIESIIIPNSVTQIDEGSFYFCKKLNKIIIENNSELTMIGKFAFYYSSIKSFSIPIHVTQICNEAFSYCEKLQIIEFNNHSDIKSIDENLINTCSHAIIMITSNIKS